MTKGPSIQTKYSQRLSWPESDGCCGFFGFFGIRQNNLQNMGKEPEKPTTTIIQTNSGAKKEREREHERERERETDSTIPHEQKGPSVFWFL